ncbi:LuxR family transcriptional regulator [Micromonospora polyrhachis]|uniref:DNA-binding CsgD family transcriptional regulator n=1 Tax=Micromonospora polyrhachis TaxID=1282883 RepID=A0A7W7SS68_9ACTN|nr:LuxR family transcriptional regulator [Micromonospora polyrhachis]MBB4959337.1 DNA-binding CsgD family transcriptional regulator [Micromonospora polyrhachis]
MLLGRDADRAVLRTAVERARAGYSAALVLRGEAGIGKSALLDDTATGSGLTVLRCAGYESEAEMPFASLHLLLYPVLGRAEALPELQRTALLGALGVGPAAGRDPLLIGASVLTLLGDLAEDQPVLCLVDDAHWLDESSARTLRFVARRLHADAVAMIFAARPEFDPAGLPEHWLDGIGASDCVALLDRWAPGLDRVARERIVRESGGNPLALRELPRVVGDQAHLPGPLPLPQRIEHAFGTRIARMTPDVRTVLTIAAADETAGLGNLLRATATCGISRDELRAALREAEQAELLRVSGGRIIFTHPLLRAAAYQQADFDERLAAHRALAEAAAAEPDQQAWHLAAAATGPDDTAARALELTAERAQGRSGHAAAAAALERAAELTGDPGLRGRRLIEAAVAANHAGQQNRTRHLLDQIDEIPTDPLRAARYYELEARVAFDSGDAARAHDLLVEASTALAEVDPVAAHAVLVDAGRNAWQLSDPSRLTDAAERLAKLGPAPDGLAAAVAAVTGAARLLTVGPVDALPAMRPLVAEGLRSRGAYALRLNAAFVAGIVGDFNAGGSIARQVVDDCRVAGAIGWLPLAHVTLATAELYLGRFRNAVSSATEGLQLTTDTGQPNRAGYLEGVLAWIAAVQGDEEECLRLSAQCHDGFTTHRIANGLAWAIWARAMLDLAHGRAAEAMTRLETALDGPVRHQAHAVYFAPDQVECAVRLGEPERGRVPCDRFGTWAEAAGQNWAQAVWHRCQGMLAPDTDVADQHFTAALRAHADGSRPWEIARTHLAFGERLRRDRRKNQARSQLRTAREMFERLPAQPWADRAAAELRAAGEQTQVDPTVDLLAALSPQELQIVKLAHAGLTNREIAAQLFLSPKTVSYHLYRAFPKLNVASRRQLARLDLPG